MRATPAVTLAAAAAAKLREGDVARLTAACSGASLRPVRAAHSQPAGDGRWGTGGRLFPFPFPRARGPVPCLGFRFAARFTRLVLLVTLARR